MHKTQLERTLDGQTIRITRYQNSVYLEFPDFPRQEYVPDVQCRVWDCSLVDLKALQDLIGELQAFVDIHSVTNTCHLVATGWTGAEGEISHLGASKARPRPLAAKPKAPPIARGP